MMMFYINPCYLSFNLFQLMFYPLSLIAIIKIVDITSVSDYSSYLLKGLLIKFG